jgi:hypothetical protein
VVWITRPSAIRDWAAQIARVSGPVLVATSDIFQAGEMGHRCQANKWGCSIHG